jgi:hypothetical protein
MIIKIDFWPYLNNKKNYFLFALKKNKNKNKNKNINCG